MKLLIQKVKDVRIDDKDYPDKDQIESPGFKPDMINYPDNNRIELSGFEPDKVNHLQDEKQIKLILSDLTNKIIGILFKVHNILGPSFKEVQYKKAIEDVLLKENIDFKKEISVHIDFKSFKLKDLRIDFIIENKLILEVKSKPFLTKEDMRQTLRYLKVTDLPLAILVNFRRKKLEYKRIINPEVIDKYSPSGENQGNQSGKHPGNNISGNHPGNISGFHPCNNISGSHPGKISDKYPGNNLLLIYVGIEKGDENKNLEEIVNYLENLQIIDENGKFAKTMKETKPVFVFISNITLLAGFEKGRINFNRALEPKLAKEIFKKLIQVFKNKGYQVFSKEFGSYLEITSTNVGPINFYLQI
ncbi:MAG: hypothetical protein KatS3mg096_238 [Candidatus Parcubacteria bacterium]|nr:MAG: hypothetical protein KatS3mg096_238 [Candidatus Parcubacteria bacterium]